MDQFSSLVPPSYPFSFENGDLCTMPSKSDGPVVATAIAMPAPQPLRPAAMVVTTVNTPSKPNKKHKRTTPKAARKSAKTAIADSDELEDSTDAKMTWTDALTTQLVEMRYSEEWVFSFSKCRSDVEKGMWWTRFADEFSIMANQTLNKKQLVNRLTKLKAEYRAIVAATNATGNSTENPIQKPPYWEAIFSVFSTQKGLKDEPLFDSLSSTQENSEDAKDEIVISCHDEESEDDKPQKKQKMTPMAELGSFLKEGMESLGNSIVDMARVSSGNGAGSAGSSLQKALERVEKMLDNHEQTTKKQNQSTELLLQWLQTQFGK